MRRLAALALLVAATAGGCHWAQWNGQATNPQPKVVSEGAP
jgi:hypothetical protein